MNKSYSQMFQQIIQENKVFYFKENQLKIAKADICLHHQLGSFIDVIWDAIKGNMILLKSQAMIQKYQKIDNFEVIKGVQFRHAYQCPYISQTIIKSQKFYKPCACVLISKSKQNILITRRNLSLNSFPGAWVLPGGHLQKNQSLIVGGMRQAQQQVGLDIKKVEITLQKGIMAWESAYCKQGKILSSNIVIFFSVFSEQFQVLSQQAQIQQYIWKDILDQKDEYKYKSSIKNGYGQAHLNYLSFYRHKNYGIKQQKKWIEQEKEKEGIERIKQKGNL